MGNSLSFIESEKLTWIDHVITFDETVRQANLTTLQSSFLPGSAILLAYQDRKFNSVPYQHWFITDGQYFLEFGSPSDLYNARVQINTVPRSPFQIETQGSVDDSTRDRIFQVLGMCNYSLCIRNCEHVANYIFRGRWVSFQMEEGGVLKNTFRRFIVDDNLRKVNAFPSTIRPDVFSEGKGKRMYSFISNHYNATQFNYFLDHNEDTYNILVIGPTGAGKSHLINIFFNQPVTASFVSHKSVTKEMCFIKGTGSVFNLKTRRYEDKKIVVADTVGLCDTEWDDAKIVSMIKGRVSSNFRYIDAVFVVFRADRLLKEHVKNIRIIMEWLGYSRRNQHLKFLFVGTFAENLTEVDVERLRGEAVEILGLKVTKRDVPDARIGSDDENDAAQEEANNNAVCPRLTTYDSLVYTGFPPEVTLNDLGRRRVERSWDLLQPLLLLHPGEALQAYSLIVEGDAPARIGIPNWWNKCAIL
ncbi:GTPase IMAP family member 4 [Folsomia candida]|uniref:GTPase IMAP family member 4 n=2 Tax=Folsomia candida TaxID=158441 RepID=A0A226CV14_FOLCA|nr:GTPase IMAP family member 4 [Folsomia candida]